MLSPGILILKELFRTPKDFFSCLYKFIPILRIHQKMHHVAKVPIIRLLLKCVNIYKKENEIKDEIPPTIPSKNSSSVNSFIIYYWYYI